MRLLPPPDFVERPAIERLTDKRGAVLMRGVAPGRWSLEVEAAGFRTATGFAQVTAGAHLRLAIELQHPQAEGSGLTRQATEDSVRKMIENANHLLARNRPSEARRQLEEVIPYVADFPLAEVLRGIARARYLEGDAAGSLAALRDALDWNPASVETRALFELLSKELGRELEVERFYDTLILTAANKRHPRGSLGDAPAELSAELSGAVTVRFNERSPHLDFNRREMEAVERAMSSLGITATLLRVPGAHPYHGQDPEWLGRALDFVEGRGRDVAGR